MELEQLAEGLVINEELEELKDLEILLKGDHKQPLNFSFTPFPMSSIYRGKVIGVVRDNKTKDLISVASLTYIKLRIKELEKKLKDL